MAYVIKSGDIKVYTINNAGEEQIVMLHNRGDIFPLSWIFSKTSTAHYYYETSSDSVILTLPRDVLREYITSAQFAPDLIDYLTTNYTGLLMRITALEQSRASEKIIYTLYYLMFRYGREIKPGIFELSLHMTHSTIASLVGLTRETTTTELNRLKAQGIVQYARRVYIINRKKLERTLGEDSFNVSL